MRLDDAGVSEDLLKGAVRGSTRSVVATANTLAVDEHARHLRAMHKS